MARPKKYKTAEEARQAKLKSNRETKKIGKKREKHLTYKQKRFAELIPISKSATQAAIAAGYKPDHARQIASSNLSKVVIQDQIAKEERNLREHLNAKGLDDGNIASRIKDYLDFNSEVVERGGNEGGKVVREMRDSRGVATMIGNVVKFKGSSLENTQNIVSEVNADTAWLAIKSLIKKLNREQLGMVIESCEALLASDCKVVS
jgi:phage terminase small subunit